jgi:hypothetical protein
VAHPDASPSKIIGTATGQPHTQFRAASVCGSCIEIRCISRLAGETDMTQDDFLKTIQVDGIRLDAFDLDGHGDECYVVAHRESRWDVYYSERGFETNARHFSTESAALDYLLQALRADPSTKV